MNKTLKRYLVSSLITFSAGFASILVVNIDNLSIDCLRDGTLAGVLFLAVRAGIKGLLEWFVATFVKE